MLRQEFWEPSRREKLKSGLDNIERTDNRAEEDLAMLFNLEFEVETLLDGFRFEISEGL